MARSHKSEVDQLKAELADMGRRLMELTGESVDEMEDLGNTFADRARDMFGEKWSRTKDFGARAGARVQDYAEENPWQLLAAGVAVGFTLAFLLKRDRD